MKLLVKSVFMKSVAQSELELSDEQRNLISKAYNVSSWFKIMFAFTICLLERGRSWPEQEEQRED